MPSVVSVNSYHYRRGGADAVYFDHAALLEAQGWKNAFFAMHHDENVESPWSRFFCDEIDIGKPYPLTEKIVKASQVVYSWEARRRLRDLLREFPADVAHLHNIYHHQSPSILPVFGEFGVPVVMTAHDLKIACPNNKMLNRLGICERCRGGRYLNVVRNRCIHDSTAASAVVAAEAVVHDLLLGSYRRHVGRIVVPSRFYLDKFVEWGWPRERFRYIPNYVEADRFDPQTAAGDYLLYFGRLAEEKGVVTLVRAAARAGVPLRLAGTGPLADALAAELHGLGEHRISLVGFQSGQALHDLIRGARAIVLPSEWYENAPISILEAFAMGKPVIGADIGGIPEAVVPGSTGWLFPSKDGERLAHLMTEVMAAPDSEVAALGAGARERVQAEFNRQRYLDETLTVYRELGVRGV